jgi:hypothetical protein
MLVKESLVTLSYSWQLNLGFVPPWQELVPGKQVIKGEMVLDNRAEFFRQQNKLERVNAYRQLQGLSHQIHLLSGKRLKLDSFQLPREANIRPIAAGEERHLVETPGDFHVVLRNRITGEEVRVLPPGLDRVKLLLLQLDQGAIGAAGVSFLEFELGYMVTAKFDKIHRLIRDMKGAAQTVAIFEKTKLWAAYLYTFNKRPFGSGAHGTLKQRLMNIFIATVTTNSPVFLKYLPRLAKAWKMPMETYEDRDNILKCVFAMRSFENHLSSPKMQNWFAWNKCCHQQMPDYWATKLVFEAVLDVYGGLEEEEGEQFSIKPCTDVRQELHRMLTGGGGCKLAFRLMKDGLHNYIKAMYFSEKASPP